jgi:hypothetical protein
MKKNVTTWLIIAVFIIMALVVSCKKTEAGTKTLNFAWSQPGSLAGFSGWKLYQADAAGAAGVLVLTIPYGGTVQAEYTGTKNLISPDGQTKIYYFTLTAFDTSGNESGRSNEVTATIDFEAPSTPVTLKVTVTTP